MTVDSYLEVFTTLFGWMLYNVLWDVLVATGIVYLPFLGILVSHWTRPAAETDLASAGSQSIRMLEIDLVAALLVVVLAAQPATLTAIRATTLEYTPVPTLNEPNPAAVTLSTNDSTFGHSAFLNSDHVVKAPAWWFSVMAVSSGVSHAVIEGLPRFSDIRQAVLLARMASISAPELRQEVANFYRDCYLPARAKYFRQLPQSATIDALFARYGIDDTEWFGSHVFRETPGYYDQFRATSPVADWPYLATRDTEYDPSSPPSWGRPHCNDWWAAPSVGLRMKVIATVNVQAAGYAGIMVLFGLNNTSEEHLDIVAKTALRNTPASWTNNAIRNENRAHTGMFEWLERASKAVTATGGVAVTAGMTSIVVDVLLQLLPLVQAIVLMCIYALLPLLLVLSRYSIRTVVATGIMIFAIKFWTVLWFMAQWIDQNLITSMYPEANLLFEMFVLNNEQGTKRLLLNTVTTLLYVGLPILWTIMIGWAGLSMGRSLDGVGAPYQKTADQAGPGAIRALRTVRGVAGGRR